MRVFLVVLLTSVAASGFFLPTIGANHAQVESGRVVVFDHRSGNEWWVEVDLSGQDAGSVSGVEAMDTDGPWVALAKKSWGPWAASFHIEPGHMVRFRANWAGGAQVTSCWFTHPEGQELCGQPNWNVSPIGNVGRSEGRSDIAIADVDNDGRRELLVPGPEGLFMFKRTSSGWTRTQVGFADFDHVAVGDVNGDGRADVFASWWDETNRRSLVERYLWNGNGFAGGSVLAIPGADVSALTVGNVVDGGLPEVYVSTHNFHTGVWKPLYQIRWDGANWASQLITTFDNGMGFEWVGDADNDGDLELVVASNEWGHTDVWLVDGTGTSWTITNIAKPAGDGTDSGVVVGDLDRDGKQEINVVVLASDQDRIDRISKNGTAWTTMTPMRFATGVRPQDLFFGDGDNDGTRELYVTGGDGHLYQVRYTDQYLPADVADVGTSESLADIALGDADNDGKNEVYASAFDFSTCCPPHDLYRFGTQPSPAPPPPPTFTASFTDVRGNEWWQQTQVTPAGGTVARVDVRVNGGNWLPLQPQSWGVRVWAGSYHAVENSRVQFRAVSTAGEIALSPCFKWIPPSNGGALSVECSTPPPPPTFDATFSGVQGNEWWVQANVAANEPLASVEARVDCGATWQPLAKQSWGGWAASFHVPNGSKVDFRARSTTGATDVSGGYTWPQATPTSGC